MQRTVILVDAGSDEFAKTIKECIKEVLQELKAMQGDLDEKSVLGIEEAAQMLGLAKQTVYALVSQRKLPHYKRGKRLYFRHDELADWIAAGKKATNEEMVNFFNTGTCKPRGKNSKS